MNDVILPYESIIFSCPECGHAVEERKYGKDVESKSYPEDSVPKPVADAIIGLTVYCPSCGDRFTIQIDTHCHTVPLFLRKG